jgi:biotin transport system substrate-specific component
MNQSIRMTVYACLFTALIIVGTYIKIPIGPVPIVLANFFVLLAGVLLGSSWATGSVALFLVLGVIGVPVFSSGGGVAAIVGPTGGYLIGYLAAAFVTGIITQRRKSRGAVDLIGLIAGALVIYVLGLPWLKHSLHIGWTKTLTLGFFPFLIGDALKVAAAFGIVRLLQGTAPELFPVLQSRAPEK